MWGGLLANIPTGWALCDGTNGTPDLRSKFIKGSAAGIDPGVTGGALTHTHTGHSAHVFTQPSAHTVTQPTAHGSLPHSGTAVAPHVGQWIDAPAGSQRPVFKDAPDGDHSVTQPNAHGSQSHTGTAVSAHAGGAVDAHSAHNSPNHEPPFYSLAFIQKL